MSKCNWLVENSFVALYAPVGGPGGPLDYVWFWFCVVVTGAVLTFVRRWPDVRNILNGLSLFVWVGALATYAARAEGVSPLVSTCLFGVGVGSLVGNMVASLLDWLRGIQREDGWLTKEPEKPRRPPLPSHLCSRCNGTGSVIAPAISMHDFNDCPKCGGSGLKRRT